MPVLSPTLNANVFQAILAMDSYNRGYGANIKIADVAQPDGSMGSPRSIGTATIKNIDLLPGSVEAGFYASAYSWNGSNVFSYRGTNPDFGLTFIDDFLNSPGFADIRSGWTLGAGFAEAAQGQLS